MSLSGATLAQNVICTFSVNVTASTMGNYINTTGAIASTNGATGGTASASLLVPADPIPALSDWGLVLMSGLTIVAGIFALRRRPRRSV